MKRKIYTHPVFYHDRINSPTCSYVHRIIIMGLACLFLLSCKKTPPDRLPNILLIVADDLGYSDLGCFGSEINTPNLDNLVKNGIRFSRFYTSPYCAVSRAMILSGNNNHIAGMGSQDLKTGTQGYEGRLTDRIIPFTELLLSKGYHTYITGKWHLGNSPNDNPHHKGFEHSFVTLEGGANHYLGKGIFYNIPESLYTEDGETTKWRDGDYSTDFYTDKLISFIDRYEDDARPFFAYAAYTSPHWPLQVDDKYWKKYIGKYDDGYEKLREIRFQNLKDKELIPENAVLPASHPGIPVWDSLTIKEKKIEARKMEIYAGMVENLDENIGRLIQYLKKVGQYDNTMIVFLSDNGAAAEDFYYHDVFGPFLQQNYTDTYESMGKPESFISYGKAWAEAGTAPFKYFKGYTTEGGLLSPMIISGHLVKYGNRTSSAMSTLMDLAPTFYDWTGIEYPKLYHGTEVYPLLGKSLQPIIHNQSERIHDDEYVFGLEHRSYAMIRKGDWKIIQIQRPFDENHFELYNLSEDLAEEFDLKDIHPDKFSEMLKEWENFYRKMKIRIPTPLEGEDF
ncbi:MAG TPA: arylsulfatase [Saprospiraceae bacterium]|nr:arylsulfatase [Saprospiraceae bacterium]